MAEQFEVDKDRAFRLKASNGQVVATGRPLTRFAGAFRGNLQA
jgi:uncharacterized protein YegP (UPF0339 family)